MKIDILENEFLSTDGKKYKIEERVMQIAISSVPTGTTSYRDGPKDYKTTTGVDLNMNADGTFTTVNGDVLTPIN